MKKKIIIPAFALLIGAALAGSVTGTAAWYQYSTKANVALIGASGGAAGNLNIRIRKANQTVNQGWTTFISKESLDSYLSDAGYGSKIRPVTPAGAMDKDDALPVDNNEELDFLANPIPGKAEYDDWKRADKANYVVIPLQLRYVQRDGVKDSNGIDEENLLREVYLSDLTLEKRTSAPAAANTEDISGALRFHISSYVSDAPTVKESRLISKKGGTTATSGKLDLDGDGNPDTARASDKYGFDEVVDTDTEIVYGDDGNQVSFTAEKLDAPATGRQYYDATNTLVAETDSVYSLIAKSREGKNGDDLVDGDANLKYDGTHSKSIGSTVASTEKFLNVDITIWVEGWHKFKATTDANDTSYSSIWNTKYINAGFNVGFEFAINAEADAQ